MQSAEWGQSPCGTRNIQMQSSECPPSAVLLRRTGRVQNQEPQIGTFRGETPYFSVFFNFFQLFSPMKLRLNHRGTIRKQKAE